MSESRGHAIVSSTGGATGADTVNGDFAVLDGVRARFESLAGAFCDTGGSLGGGHDDAVAGAGQFTGDLRPGAVKFLLSWRAAFKTVSTDCRLIAGNTGRQAVDLKAADTHLAGQTAL
jgi:hypothetical protein